MKRPIRQEIDTEGCRIVVLEGVVDATAAWEVVKWLEGLGPEDYPLVLDLSRSRAVHWLAVEILNTGVQSLNSKTGPVRLKFSSGPA